MKGMRANMKKATKRQVFLQLASAIMVLVLIISIAPAIAAEDGTGAAITPYAEYGNPNSNPNGRYLSDVLGISRQQYINHLTANQDKYLGTRYAGGSVMNYSWEYGPWWAKGYPSPTGYVGMNCGGFVAATFYNAGATNSNSAFMHSWYYSGYDLGQWSNA
ncbi:MAG: hypothetical protein FWD43_04100, partial [Coriobacteriia bacterium]|nr:hypothetical protein [Coriobacteriia bacterium]